METLKSTETRTLKQLLSIVRDSLGQGHKKGWLNLGICGEISGLYKYGIISGEEVNILNSYLPKNKPNYRNRLCVFTQNNYWGGILYWWRPMNTKPKTRQIRIDYLNALISELN